MNFEQNHCNLHNAETIEFKAPYLIYYRIPVVVVVAVVIIQVTYPHINILLAAKHFVLTMGFVLCLNEQFSYGLRTKY